MTQKRIQAARLATGHNPYAVAEAVAVLQEHARAKFDETVEIAYNLGIDTRHADQQVRGTVELPHGSGKVVRVAVFARGTKAEEAQAAGADFVGAEDLVEQIQGGMMDFDQTIATPDMMALVGRLGRVLGPRNLMPNPKTGTVTMQVGSVVESIKKGRIQFRSEKGGVVQAGIGKASFKADHIQDNIKAFHKAITQAKPSGAKGTYIHKVVLSSTMGPGIPLDPDSLRA